MHHEVVIMENGNIDWSGWHVSTDLHQKLGLPNSWLLVVKNVYALAQKKQVKPFAFGAKGN